MSNDSDVSIPVVWCFDEPEEREPVTLRSAQAPGSGPFSKRLLELQGNIIRDAVAPIRARFVQQASALQLQALRKESQVRRVRERHKLLASAGFALLCACATWTGVALAKERSVAAAHDGVLLSQPSFDQAAHSSALLDSAHAEASSWQRQILAAKEELQALRDAVAVRADGHLSESETAAVSPPPVLRPAASPVRKVPTTRVVAKTKGGVRSSSAPTRATSEAGPSRPQRCEPNDPMSYDPLNDCLP